MKNNLLCDEEQNIWYLSPTEVGSKHDKKMADEDPLVLPQGSVLKQDLGYEGHAPVGVEVEIPFKNYKKKPLTFAQRIYNRLLSSTRIPIEHVNSGVKRLRIVKDRIRIHAYEIRDTLMVVACGLHNLRVKSTCRKYASA